MIRKIFLLLLCLLFPLLGTQAEPLRVDFYDVGKADAALITLPDGMRVLIDTATNKEGKQLAKRLAEEGVSQIDLMLITHYDKDHVGGADSFLENMDVREVVIPIYEKDSKQLTQFMEALEKSPDTIITNLGTGKMLERSLGGATLAFTAAHAHYYGVDEENDFSIALRLRYGDTRFFFTGDAEDARQRELLDEGDVACDVLKVPYHGNFVDCSERFLKEAAPKIAFITDDDEQPASNMLLRVLADVGAEVHSARDGDLTVFSDGTKVWRE